MRFGRGAWPTSRPPESRHDREGGWGREGRGWAPWARALRGARAPARPPLPPHSAPPQAILNTLHAETGKCSLEHLRSLPTPEACAALTRFNGVGPKTAACVALFALGRPEFPVDTHVHRIAGALGWLPRVGGREVGTSGTWSR